MASSTMALVYNSNNNDDIIIPTLPQGFEVCNHSHTCPSCKSTLVYKVSTTNTTNTAESKAMKEERTTQKDEKNKVLKNMFASTACYCTTTTSDDDTLLSSPPSLLEEDDLKSNLQTANNANKLLQALSFDASTRSPTTKMGLDLINVTENVSYCLDCKVHVITTSRELELLFDDAENGVVGSGEGGGGEGSGDEVGGNNMEWLRGSLLVDVDESEVLASRGVLKSIPSIQEQNTGLSSILGNYNNTTTADTNEGGKSPHKDRDDTNNNNTKKEAVKLPTRPNQFDYEYRHKVATQTMASKIVKGYTLVDEICEECEMPLMIKQTEGDNEEEGIKDVNKGKKGGEQCKKECVVCPKLYKKIKRYAQSGGYAHPSPSTGNGIDGTSLDPILAIIANARSEAPTQTKRYVQPDIAEAKQYVMQRQIMSQTAVSSSSPKIKSLVDNCCEDDKDDTEDGCSQGTASMTDHESEDDHLTLSTNGADGGKNKLNIFHNNTNPGINWDELLFNGRTILSKRLNEGWVLSSTNCCGVNCNGTPLLQRLDENGGEGLTTDTNYCAVCGGTGSGEDGAYAVEIALQVKAAELADRVIQESTPNWEELAANGRALLAERLKQGWTMSSENCSGFHCNDMPLTNIEGGPNSCVVCGGSGNGKDGSYENYKPKEVVEEERALVSSELSRLVSMGWVIRENLCTCCLMPLVAEEEDAKDELCILCGHLLANNPHGNNVEDGGEDEEVDDGADDSYMNETVYESETLKQAVIAPVSTYGNDNANAAGKRLVMGWTLPDAGLCYHCNGIQMSPPNSQEVGCIQRGCPSALAAAYTILPEPHESQGPVRLIGRGYSKAHNEREEEEEAVVQPVYKSEATLSHHHQHRHRGNMHQIYEEEEMDYDDLPFEVNRHKNNVYDIDEPSVLSEDDLPSVASAALGDILVQLDDAKYELEVMQGAKNVNPEECAQKQVEIAELIERLSSAAVQLKQREGI